MQSNCNRTSVSAQNSLSSHGQLRLKINGYSPDGVSEYRAIKPSCEQHTFYVDHTDRDVIDGKLYLVKSGGDLAIVESPDNSDAMLGRVVLEERVI